MSVSSANPYAAPTADLSEPKFGRKEFTSLSTKQLKVLRNHSRTIRTLGALWIVAAIVLILSTMTGGLESKVIAAVIGFLCFVAASIYACYARPIWGRAVGIVFCCGILFGFPIGTIFGILGLIAFIQGRQLFGPERFLGKDLEREYKYRKKNDVE